MLQESWELILKIEKFLIEKTDQRSRSLSLVKHSCIYLYYVDLNKWYTIDVEDIQFVNIDGCALIGIPDELDGTSNDHEYFFIIDNEDISLDVISKMLSSPPINDCNNKQSNKLRKKYKFLHLTIHFRRKDGKHSMNIQRNILMISSWFYLSFLRTDWSRIVYYCKLCRRNLSISKYLNYINSNYSSSFRSFVWIQVDNIRYK